MKENVISQWKNYINWVNYKIFLKKKINKLNIETSKIQKEIKKKQEIKVKGSELISLLKPINEEDKSLQINLIGSPKKHTSIKKNIERIFKFDGYLMYGNKSKDFKIIKIKNLSMIYKHKNKESYNIIDKIGTHKGKPLFMVLYPHAISLTIDDKGELFYDAESYYTYVDYATNSNLLKVGQEGNISDLIKKNMPIIIFAIIILAVLFTPEGQEMLKSFMGGN